MYSHFIFCLFSSLRELVRGVTLLAFSEVERPPQQEQERLNVSIVVQLL